MLIHHILSNTKTPFGDPMVAPKEYEYEANELLDLVLSLHEHVPQFSIPDLWTLVTAKALARLGGPNVSILRGRDGTEDKCRDDLLTFPPAVVSEDNRDVLNLKRSLAKQQFSIEQLVALIGCARTVGFHEGTHFHTQEKIKPLMRRPMVTGPTEDEFHLPDTIGKCTVDPYVFGSEYFDLLLDYNWKQHGLLKKEPFYRCSESSRVRDVVLIDPFSAQKTEQIDRIVAAEEKHQKEVKNYFEKNSSVLEGKSPADMSKYGRTGEAQMIPGKEPTKVEPEHTTHVDFETEEPSKHVDPCSHVSMRGIDVMLLDDALTRGWLHRFSSNEVDFYSTVTDIVLEVQRRGHNENELYVYHK
ncbi:cytochrome c peroxidase [Strigomonas culicis]|uniref:Cytochrome c peroxidase n=1 Tax=Strigomonas culicis TaxID=28005 RepID=S9WC81_9TRYP|nr:cytochrome c peroxidase [Strigomonas culicis]|eukprot:EPY36721.1 cytochrome c peroxidase [Strigomonas culicis]